MSRTAEPRSGLADKITILLELVKFEHSVFALPYAYIGALYGAAWVSKGLAGWPSVADIIWITLVMVGARAFAFVLNRAIDREIDARNPRTAGRAVPAGLIKAGELWLFAAVMLVVYIVGIWQLAEITRLLWPIPLLVFFVYPYTKRFTPLCHYWLGLALGLAPVGGWVAVGGPILHPAPWLLGLAVLLWTAGFDIIYATQDLECDLRDGVHSMPADLGVGPSLIQTRVVHAVTVLLLVLGGYLAGAGWPWFAGTAIAAALLWYENSIVAPGRLERVNAAFFTVNGIIALVVGAGALADRIVG
ncbi:MAG: UbiA-like polyprenyltransferase [Coriobacteriia bacterium]